MNINRYNYHEYFLLYTDNELNASERKAVDHFVLTNPDLQEELLTLQQSVFIADEELVFEDKQLLLFDKEENFIHPGNFEELCISYADNELHKADRNRLERFVRTHPQLQKQFALILSLKLPADKSILFTDKESLYRYEKQPVPFRWWRMAAAAILLFTGGFLWLNKRPNNTTINVLSQAAETKPATLAPVTIKEEQPVMVKADNTVDPAKQVATAMVLSQNKKTVKNQKIPTQVKHKDIVMPAHVNSFAGTIASKRLNVKKLETAVQVNPDKKLQVDPKYNSSAVVNLTPRQSPEKINVERPTVINALNNYDHNADVSANEVNENVLLTNIPVDRKNSLRGIFRKAARYIDKSTAFRPSKPSSLLIGNIEIAFQ